MVIFREVIARYTHEQDFYEAVCYLAAKKLEVAIQAAGVRGMVTWRTKSPERLKEKCRQRSHDDPGASAEEIFAGIVDLAGVRLALYFPADRDRVGTIIREYFQLIEDRLDFPKRSPKEAIEDDNSGLKRRFPGYSAQHYRVHLNRKYLSEAEQKYAEARLEIQVASVLMHAWSEVEHDLIYK